MNYVNNKGFVCPTTVSTNDGKILNYKSFGKYFNLTTVGFKC